MNRLRAGSKKNKSPSRHVLILLAFILTIGILYGFNILVTQQHLLRQSAVLILQDDLNIVHEGEKEKEEEKEVGANLMKSSSNSSSQTYPLDCCRGLVHRNVRCDQEPLSIGANFSNSDRKENSDTNNVNGMSVPQQIAFQNNNNPMGQNLKDKETAILVTTNWIPSAPSIGLVKEVIDSLSLLEGLSPRAPTYIVIDHIFPESHRDGKTGQARLDMEATLEEYSFNIMKEYMHRENFHVIVNKVNLHIGGNLNKTLELLEPETKYLYFIQHDFKFIKPINHTAMVNAMKEYPDRIKHVRFNKKTNVPKRRGDECWKESDAEIHVDGANFTKTSGWSDNNHFSSVKHYKALIQELGSYIYRPLEAPMQHKMYRFPNCSEWAQHLYGAPWQGRYIMHLDGRNSWGVRRVQG